MRLDTLCHTVDRESPRTSGSDASLGLAGVGEHTRDSSTCPHRHLLPPPRYQKMPTGIETPSHIRTGPDDADSEIYYSLSSGLQIWRVPRRNALLSNEPPSCISPWAEGRISRRRLQRTTSAPYTTWTGPGRKSGGSDRHTDLAHFMASPESAQS